jgi:hypothetical protein
MFALASDGKTNKKGMPNPFRLAVIANAHVDTVVLPFPPYGSRRLRSAPRLRAQASRAHARARYGARVGAGALRRERLERPGTRTGVGEAARLSHARAHARAKQ